MNGTDEQDESNSTEDDNMVLGLNPGSIMDMFNPNPTGGPEGGGGWYDTTNLFEWLSF